MAGGGRAAGGIYPDFCKAFDVVPRHILLSELERRGFEGWMLDGLGIMWLAAAKGL